MSVKLETTIAEDERDDEKRICLIEAAQTTLDAVEHALESTREFVVAGVDSETGVTIFMVRTLSRHGNVVDAPNVEFAEVVDVTPGGHDVRDIEGKVIDCQNEVHVRKAREQRL